MPIYEYQCQECGHEIEILQKISDDPLRDCTACGKPALRKKVSAAAFRLKGGGWYETDFKTGDKKNLAGSQDGKDSNSKDGKSKDSAGDSKSGGDTKGDSKKSA